MITKTISGHFDTVFSLNHNNRVFTPSNVDAERKHWNYNCVMAGQLVPVDLENLLSSSEIWGRYRMLCDLYSAVLHSDVIDMYHGTDDYEKLLFYLRYCSDEDYQRIMKEVDVFWDQFATRQQTKALESLKEKVVKAEKNTLKQGEPLNQRRSKEKQR